MGHPGDLPDPAVVGRLREGMDVRTSDGEVIGTVTQLWQGSDPAERELRRAIQDREGTYGEALGSRQGVFLEVRTGEGEARYIPWQVVGDIGGECVTLKVSGAAAAASEWGRRPDWIDG